MNALTLNQRNVVAAKQRKVVASMSGKSQADEIWCDYQRLAHFYGVDEIHGADGYRLWRAHNNNTSPLWLDRPGRPTVGACDYMDDDRVQDILAHFDFGAIALEMAVAEATACEERAIVKKQLVASLIKKLLEKEIHGYRNDDDLAREIATDGLKMVISEIK